MNDLNKLSINELHLVIKQAESALKNIEVSKRKKVLVQIKELAASVGVVVEIHAAEKKQKRKGMKVAPKYCNPNDSSLTWSGRGVMPRWMRTLTEAGHNKSEYLI